MSQAIDKKLIGSYLLLFLVPMFWAGAFGAAKHVTTEVPPITAATIRYGSAGIILFIIVLIKEEIDIKAIKKRWLELLVMSVIGFFGFNAFFFLGIQFTSATNGALIMATSPIFITLGAVIFLKEPFGKKLLIGMSCSLLGVFIVITKGDLQTITTLSFNVGDILFIGTMLCWSAHGVIGKVVMKEISPLMTTTFTTIVGSLCLGIVSFFEHGWGNVSSLSHQSWFELLYMSLFASVIGFILWNSGVKKIGASTAGVFMNFVPINAVWISFVFYNAQILWLQIIGILLVITGVTLTFNQNRVNLQIRKQNVTSNSL